MAGVGASKTWGRVARPRKQETPACCKKARGSFLASQVCRQAAGQTIPELPHALENGRLHADFDFEEKQERTTANSPMSRRTVRHCTQRFSSMDMLGIVVVVDYCLGAVKGGEDRKIFDI